MQLQPVAVNGPVRGDRSDEIARDLGAHRQLVIFAADNSGADTRPGSMNLVQASISLTLTIYTKHLLAVADSFSPLNARQKENLQHNVHKKLDFDLGREAR